MTRKQAPAIEPAPVVAREISPASVADLRQQHAEAIAHLVVLKTASPRSADAIAAQKQVIQRLAEMLSQRDAEAAIH